MISSTVPFHILIKWISCTHIVPPRISPFAFGDDPSNFGESASVQCNVIAGDLPVEIAWQLNGLPIDEAFISTGKMGKRLSILNIDSVSGYHAGNYTCTASNAAGFVDHTAHLIVIGTNLE